LRVLYRAGQIERAAAEADRVAAETEAGPLALLFVAMTRQRQGRKEDARRAYDAAVKKMAEAPTEDWDRKLERELLRAEAAKAVGLP
jgi:hypothetical protein